MDDTDHLVHAPGSLQPLRQLVGDGVVVPCLDGSERSYLSCDAAASTAALEGVLARVEEFLPWYSSVHRGAGFKSRRATDAYEAARRAALHFAGRTSGDDVAIICRNTTEALNHLVYRLSLEPDDVVVTTVVEHHANLLPWSRAARCRYVECAGDGTFDTSDVVSALASRPYPKLLAITGASNISGWMPPLDEITSAAHERGIPVVVDGAQLAPHRPLPIGADFVAWSGHKMYAPFGAGVLIGPRTAFSEGDPFLAGGGAVDLVDLDEVEWTDPPEREEAGSPNVVGAVALHAAADELEEIGWATISEHDRRLSHVLRSSLAAIPGVHLLGPSLATETLPVATFVVDRMAHSLVAARLSAEAAVGVRHGCFCAHPYLMRLLGLGRAEVQAFRDQVRAGDRSKMPGAVRASLGINAGEAEVARLCDALRRVVTTPPDVTYRQDTASGDYFPDGPDGFWLKPPEDHSATCSPG